MDKNSFLQEVHSFIDARYELYSSYQAIVLSILNEFDRICKLANIQYVLSYGNLIGAIRDGGQLPWDYDVDVVLSYEKRDDLIYALNNYLNSDFYYCYCNNIPNYPTSCLRVGKTGFSWLALHVDVFFYIGLPDDKEQQRCIKNRIDHYDRIKHIRNYTLHQLEKEESSGIYNCISKVATTLRRFLYSGNELERELDKLAKKYPEETANYILPVGEGAHIWEKAWFDPIEWDFGGRLFPIPKEYEKILEVEYKDYMSYLPIKSRFEEFYSLCNIVEKRQKLYEQREGRK